MVQRIQSLFLLMTDAVLIALFFIPYMYGLHLPGDPRPKIEYTFLDMDNPVPMIGQIVICMLAAVTVVQFRNRGLQMKLSIVGAVLSLAYTGYLVSIPYMQTETASAPGTWITMANFVLFLLAWKFIKKDDEMVRSSDRIR